MLSYGSGTMAENVNRLPSTVAMFEEQWWYNNKNQIPNLHKLSFLLKHILQKGEEGE